MRNPNRTASKRRAENEENVRPDTIVVASGRYGSCNGVDARALEPVIQEILSTRI